MIVCVYIYMLDITRIQCPQFQMDADIQNGVWQNSHADD